MPRRSDQKAKLDNFLTYLLFFLAITSPRRPSGQSKEELQGQELAFAAMIHMEFTRSASSFNNTRHGSSPQCTVTPHSPPPSQFTSSDFQTVSCDSPSCSQSQLKNLESSQRTCHPIQDVAQCHPVQDCSPIGSSRQWPSRSKEPPVKTMWEAPTYQY